MLCPLQPKCGEEREDFFFFFFEGRGERGLGKCTWASSERKRMNDYICKFSDLPRRVLRRRRENADLPLLPGPHTATTGGGQVQESYATASAASSHSRSLPSDPSPPHVSPLPIALALAAIHSQRKTHSTLAGGCSLRRGT